MSRRGKILLGLGLGLLVVITVALLLYFLVFAKNIRRVSALGDTAYTVSEFTKSEMEMFDTGTFHIKIIRTTGEGDELYFLGIGTYDKEGNGYKLTFVSAVGRQNTVGIVDVTDIVNARGIYELSQNRIKFIDHNNQEYYFG